jgi:preprotein translocase subunit YajC
MNIRLTFKSVLSVFTVGLFSLLFMGGVTWADGVAVPAGTSVATAASPAAQGPGGIMAFAPFLLMFGVMYFLVLRPQQKKLKEQQEMISALKQGDEVVTASGLLGKVTGMTEKVITVEIAQDVRVKMLKSQVSQVIKGSIKDLA